MSTKKNFGGEGSRRMSMSTGTRKGSARPKVYAEADDHDAERTKIQNKYTGYVRTSRPRDGSTATDFPVQLAKPDKRDTLMAIKRDLVGPTGAAGTHTGATPYGMAQLQDADIEWLERKRKQQELLRVYGFVDNHFDRKDPAERAMIMDIMPEYFRRRLDVIKEQAALQVRMAELRLLGPRSKEDLLLMKAIADKDLPLPQGPLWKPESWGMGNMDDVAYVRGLFNIKKWTDATRTTPSPANKYDPLADPTRGANFDLVAAEGVSSRSRDYYDTNFLGVNA